MGNKAVQVRSLLSMGLFALLFGCDSFRMAHDAALSPRESSQTKAPNLKETRNET